MNRTDNNIIRSVFLILLFGAAVCNAQTSINQLLKEYNTESIPYITVEALSKIDHDTIILDAREPHEFEISHLNDAVCVGFDYFNIDLILEKYPLKNQKIVVYCSLGIRSEVVAQKMKDAGYTNVLNLYGGIFEWKNKGFEVYDMKNNPTQNVHVFSEEWGKWLKKGEKIY